MRKFRDFLRERDEKQFNWSRNPKDMLHLNKTIPPVEANGGVPLKLGYGAYQVFQRYWQGQDDPLYALLSRRGDSVDFVTVFATPEEADRLKQAANEIIAMSKDDGEIRTAKHILANIDQ